MLVYDYQYYSLIAWFTGLTLDTLTIKHIYFGFNEFGGLVLLIIDLIKNKKIAT